MRAVAADGGDLLDVADAAMKDAMGEAEAVAAVAVVVLAEFDVVSPLATAAAVVASCGPAFGGGLAMLMAAVAGSRVAMVIVGDAGAAVGTAVTAAGFSLALSRILGGSGSMLSEVLPKIVRCLCSCTGKGNH